MRHKKKFLSKNLLIAAGGAAGLLLIPLSQALAGSTGSLGGLAGFSQVLVDSAAGPGYVFLAGTSGISVTDTRGNLITTIDQGEPVSGLALGPGGATLYAAVPQASSSPTDTGSPAGTPAPTDTGSPGSGPGGYEIDAISVPSIGSPAPRISAAPLPVGDVPHSLAYQGGTLWVSYTGSDGKGGIGGLTASSGFTPAPGGGWPVAPDLAADPSGGGTLVAAEGALAQVFTTAGGTLTPGTATPQVTSLGDCPGETQLAVAPGGADFYAVCAGPAGPEINEYSTTSDLAMPAAPSIPGGNVAVAPDGSLAAGSGPAIGVYNSSGTRVNIVSPTGGGPLAPNGLAWDGSQLDEVVGGGPYSLGLTPSAETTAVTVTVTRPATAYTGYVRLSGTVTFSSDLVPGNAEVTVIRTGGPGALPPRRGIMEPGGVFARILGKAVIGSNGTFTLTDTSVTTPGSYTYHVEYPGATTASVTVNVARNSAVLSLAGPARADVTRNFTLTGTLGFRGGTPPAGSEITIIRTYGRQVSRYPVRTAANGTFTFGQAVTSTGEFTFTAAYAGDPAMGIARASASHAVRSIRMTPSLSLTSPARYDYFPTMRVTIHLGPTYRNRTVYLYAREAGRNNRLLGKEMVNARGLYTASFRTPYTTTFTAVFRGDARYSPKTVTRTVTVVARVTLSLNGYYASRTINGTVYRLYRYNGQLGITEDVLPANKYGECGWIEVQEYYNGAWHANENTSCTDLSASSQLIGWLSMTHADRGYEYRLRAHFDRSKTDNSDANSQSGWQYVMVES